MELGLQAREALRLVAHQLHNTAAMGRDPRLDDLPPVCLKRRECSCLIGSHKARITNNVRNKYGGKLTFQYRSPIEHIVSAN